MKLSELEQKPPKVLEYGPFGGGKTAFLETLGKDLQLLDVDDGAITGLQGVKDPLTSKRQEIDVVQFLEKDPLQPSVFGDVKTKLLGVSAECARGTYKFKAIGLDSLTSLSDHCIRYVLRNQGKAVGSSPVLQDWGMIILELKNLLIILRSLPLVVVLVAHDTSETVDNNVQKMISVNGRKLPEEIPTFFDEVLHFKVRDLGGGKKIYAIQTVSTSSVPARSRHGIADGFDTSRGMVEMFKTIGFDFEKFQSPFERAEALKKGVPSTPTPLK